MAQQFLTIIAVADYGDGRNVIRNPRQLVGMTMSRQEDHPWLLYYARWFDPWLMGDSYIRPAKVTPSFRLTCIDNDVHALRPTRSHMVGLKASLLKKFQFQEQYWYNWHLYQACMSFSRLRKFKRRAQATV